MKLIKVTSLTTSVQKLFRYKIHQITQDYIITPSKNKAKAKRERKKKRSEKFISLP